MPCRELSREHTAMTDFPLAPQRARSRLAPTPVPRLFQVTILLAAAAILTPMRAEAQDPGRKGDQVMPLDSPDAQPPMETEPPTEQPRRTVESAIREAETVLERLEGRVVEDKPALLAEAADLVEFITRREPAHPMLPYISGRLLAAAGRPREAVDELQNFVESSRGRNEWRAYLIMGDLLVDQYPRLAKSHYDKAAELRPGEISILFGQAQCLSSIGKGEDAIRLARQVVQMDGEQTAKYVIFLSRVLFSDGQFADAEEMGKLAVLRLREMIAERPQARQPYLSLDAVYNLLVRIASARTTAEEEFNEQGWINLAGLMREQIEVKHTLSLFDVAATMERGLNLAGDQPIANLLMEYGVLLTKLARWREAREVFRQIIDENPDRDDAREWLNITDENLGNGAPANGDSAEADEMEAAESEQ